MYFTVKHSQKMTCTAKAPALTKSFCFRCKSPSKTAAAQTLIATLTEVHCRVEKNYIFLHIKKHAHTKNLKSLIVVVGLITPNV